MSNSMIPVSCDVLIIGGGPGGSIAASHLAMKGIDVVVLEKEKFPRYKVGESLIPHFWKYTDAIGVSDKIVQEGFIKKAGGFVQWDNTLRSVSFKDYGFTRSALHVERDRFDQILLDHSETLGAQVFQSVLVSQVETLQEFNIVHYQDLSTKAKGQIKCTYIIDASGQNVVLAKKNNWLEYDQKFKFQAFWAYYDQTSYLNAKCEVKNFTQRFIDPPMTLISSTGDWGWVWKIVMKEKVSIGAIIPQEHLDRFKKYGGNLKTRFENYLADTPITAPLMTGSNLISDILSVKDYTYRSTHYAFDHCYLVGDAAAFFDPINSEGITMAMYSSYLAAWAISNALHKPQRQSFYRDTYIKHIKNRLTLFYLLTYPDKNIPQELLDEIKDSIINQSDTENYLTFSQLTLTSRAFGFDQILKQFGLTMNKTIHTVDLPPSLIHHA